MMNLRTLECIKMAFKSYNHINIINMFYLFVLISCSNSSSRPPPYSDCATTLAPIFVIFGALLGTTLIFARQLYVHTLTYI